MAYKGQIQAIVKCFGLFLTSCLMSFIYFCCLCILVVKNNCIMKKILLGFVFLTGVTIGNAQSKDTTGTGHKNWTNFDLSNRANDHFMIQYGYDGWVNTTDTSSPSGFSRHFNFYVMMDKPSKTNQHISIGYGIGLGSSNMFFSNRYIDLKSQTQTLPFEDVTNASVNHFKKFKLTTIFLEVPAELRYATNPVTPDKGYKFAIGLKAGYLISAYTKGKNALDGSGASLYGSGYKDKEYDSEFINHVRVAATARIGIGNFSIDGSYQLTNFLKPNAGTIINPFSIGFTVSGL